MRHREPARVDDDGGGRGASPCTEPEERERQLALVGVERPRALLRGEIDVEVIDSEHELLGKPGPYGRGQIHGPFEADLVDCSSWKGPYPF